MKKAEFIKEIAHHSGMKQTEAAVFLDILAAIIKEELIASGESILPGIGKFKVVTVAERQCRNPITGEKIMSPAHEVVKFKVTKSFMG